MVPKLVAGLGVVVWLVAVICLGLMSFGVIDSPTPEAAVFVGFGGQLLTALPTLYMYHLGRVAGRLSPLEREVGQLRDVGATRDESIRSLQTSILASFGTMNSTMASLTTTVSNVQNSVTTMQSQIGDLRRDVVESTDTLRQAVSGLSVRVEVLESRLPPAPPSGPS